jgi:alkylhydroperoxidase family enzyme
MRWLARTLGLLPAGPRSLQAYAGLGSWGVSTVELDDRLELIVRQLSAELSACGWCIAQGRHRWRRAFLPEEPLRELRTYATSSLFSERERAALALTEAVAAYSERDATAAEAVLNGARAHFGEVEIAHIVHLAAAEHFYNPATGVLGADVAGILDGDVSAGAMPWGAVARGIAVMGWW